MSVKIRMNEFEEMIAVSIYIVPCTTVELKERDFLKNKSDWGIERALHYLDMKGEAIVYSGSKDLHLKDMKMKIKKSFMKTNGLLTKYELE